MGVENFESPMTNRRYIWFAKYFDDSCLYEFDNVGKEGDFTKVDKDSLKEFGIIGHGSKIWFNSDNGVIQILNPGQTVPSTIGFYLTDDKDELIRLTNRNDRYKDIIQYKFGGIWLDPRGAETTNDMSADQHFFGYKTEIETEKGKLFFKLIFVLDLTGAPCQIQLRLSTEFDIKGNLFTVFNNIPSAEPNAFEMAKGTSINLIKQLVSSK